MHEKICNVDNKCKTNLIDSKISSEIQLAILKKAAVLEKNKIEKTVEEYRKKFPTGAGKVEGSDVINFRFKFNNFKINGKI